MKTRFNKLVVGSTVLLAPLALLAQGTPDAAIETAVENASATFQTVLAAGLVITGAMIGWSFLKRIKKG